MTPVEAIKLKVLEVNELGHYIIKIAETTKNLEGSVQEKYVPQILNLISTYKENLKEIEALVTEHMQNEHNVIDLDVRRIYDSLYNKSSK